MTGDAASGYPTMGVVHSRCALHLHVVVVVSGHDRTSTSVGFDGALGSNLEIGGSSSSSSSSSGWRQGGGALHGASRRAYDSSVLSAASSLRIARTSHMSATASATSADAADVASMDDDAAPPDSAMPPEMVSLIARSSPRNGRPRRGTRHGGHEPRGGRVSHIHEPRGGVAHPGRRGAVRSSLWSDEDDDSGDSAVTDSVGQRQLLFSVHPNVELSLAQPGCEFWSGGVRGMEAESAVALRVCDFARMERWMNDGPPSVDGEEEEAGTRTGAKLDGLGVPDRGGSKFLVHGSLAFPELGPKFYELRQALRNSGARGVRDGPEDEDPGSSASVPREEDQALRFFLSSSPPATGVSNLNHGAPTEHALSKIPPDTILARVLRDGDTELVWREMQPSVDSPEQDGHPNSLLGLGLAVTDGAPHDYTDHYFTRRLAVTDGATHDENSRQLERGADADDETHQQRQLERGADADDENSRSDDLDMIFQDIAKLVKHRDVVAQRAEERGAGEQARGGEKAAPPSSPGSPAAAVAGAAAGEPGEDGLLVPGGPTSSSETQERETSETQQQSIGDELSGAADAGEEGIDESFVETPPPPGAFSPPRVETAVFPTPEMFASVKTAKFIETAVFTDANISPLYALDALNSAQSRLRGRQRQFPYEDLRLSLMAGFPRSLPADVPPTGLDTSLRYLPRREVTGLDTSLRGRYLNLLER